MFGGGGSSLEMKNAVKFGRKFKYLFFSVKAMKSMSQSLGKATDSAYLKDCDQI